MPDLCICGKVVCVSKFCGPCWRDYAIKLLADQKHMHSDHENALLRARKERDSMRNIAVEWEAKCELLEMRLIKIEGTKFVLKNLFAALDHTDPSWRITTLNVKDGDEVNAAWDACAAHLAEYKDA